MSIGFPTVPLALGHVKAGGGTVENPQPAQRFHYRQKPCPAYPGHR